MYRDFATMWKYAKRQYLAKLILLIEGISGKKLKVTLQKTLRGCRVLEVTPSWKQFKKGIKATITTQEEQAQFKENIISFWQKFMIAILFIGLPTPRISDIDSVR